MGKISNYVRVVAAKLQDVFVCDQTDNNVTTTKSVTVEQIGNAICGEQIHSNLKTDNQTIIGGINELAKDKNVADEYDDTHTYNTGDVTIYGNTLYICTANNTTGDFDPSKWTATTIDNVIGSLSTLTTTDKSSLVGAVNELDSTKQDKLLIQSGEKTGSGGVIPNGVNTYSVTFATPYASVPAVQVCFSSSTSQFLASEVQKCCTSNVTKTGFDIITACAQSRYGTVQWLAIGYE